MAHLTGLLFLLLLSVTTSNSEPFPDKEHQVKAVFLFNFPHFVQWPDNVFSGPKDTLVIGILGYDPFDGYLDNVVRGEKVNEHPLRVERYQRVEDVKACQILFIGSSDPVWVKQTMETLKTRHILTIGESENFSRDGGIISFVKENQKIRFHINQDAARTASITLSSKLLSLSAKSQPNGD